MKTITTKTMELKGSSYEIGRALGRAISSVLPLKKAYTAGFDGFGSQEVKEAEKLFKAWCPGLNEELSGFADEVNASNEEVIYYAMTYLKPNCSQLALLPSKTTNSHPLLARSYEFSEEAEDFMLIKTAVKGKYTHMGTSVLSFGRDDGFNEHGLAVTMSSCGVPVGAQKGMRRPAVRGLMFWAVIRTILENCRNTKEALDFLKDMPIAFNMNLILLDKSGHGALVETLDGKKESVKLDACSELPYIHAENHPVMERFISIEPEAMTHSFIRHEFIKNTMENTDKVTRELLKDMLSAHYPDGLCCHYYKDFFGTTKSMIIDPVDGTIELCWGGRWENGWHPYRLADPLPTSSEEISIDSVPAPPGLFEYQAIKEPKGKQPG